MNISLCTQIRDRNKYLPEAYASWIKHPFSEIIVVDSPVEECAWDVIGAMGICPVTRYIKITDNIPYNSSEMKNTCIRASSCGIVLYIDADVVIKTEDSAVLFNSLTFPVGSYLQGEKNTIITYTTGTFCFHRQDYESIGGFNEKLTDYGGDDGDVYHRLFLAGVKRLPLPPLFEHINHPDGLRTRYYANKDKILSGLKNTLKSRSYRWSSSDTQRIFNVEEFGCKKDLVTYKL